MIGSSLMIYPRGECVQLLIGAVGECCQNEKCQLSGLVHNNGGAIFKRL